MRCAERVVFALGTLGEAGKSAALTKCTDAVAPASENLMRVGLVADVPDQLVAGRVEHVVQGNGQFHDAEPGTKMASGFGHSIDRLATQFVGELAKLIGGEVFQVARKPDPVEQRIFGRF